MLDRSKAKSLSPPPHTEASYQSSPSCTLRLTQALTALFRAGPDDAAQKYLCSGSQENGDGDPLCLQSTAETAEGARGHRSPKGACRGGYQAARPLHVGMNQVEILLTQTSDVQPGLMLYFGL